MNRFLLALLDLACRLFTVDTRCLGRGGNDAARMTPESFGR